MLTTLVLPALAACLLAPPCTCVVGPPLSTQAAAEATRDASSAVFEGVVERIEFVEDTVAPNSSVTPTRAWRSADAIATVRVRRLWKGTLDRTVFVRTSAQTTMCGASLLEGRTYLIFGQSPAYSGRGAATPVQRGDTVFTSKCTWTTGVGREMRSIIGLLGQPVTSSAPGD
jgi:hypothetical protein